MHYHRTLALNAQKLMQLRSCCLYNRKSAAFDVSAVGRPIDLRSDTVTQPSAAMRRSMSECLVGDDVYREDPTVNELENQCSKLFGKEAALFCASGSMANLIALLVHCKRGDEIILGDQQHIFRYEQGGYASIAGVSAYLLKNQSDGTLLFDDLEKAIRDSTDVHQPRTRLLCLENTHNMCGGRPLSEEYLKKVLQWSTTKGILVHIDGARIYNAAVALNTSVASLSATADSVSMCFSKGLGCPVGSILVGSGLFIEKARFARKLLGGGMRQAGVLAACCLIALESAKQKLSQDHHNAKLLAKGLNSIAPDRLAVDCDNVYTNIVFAHLLNGLSADDVAEGLSKMTPPVLCQAKDSSTLRLVTHCDCNADDVQLVVQQFAKLLSSL